MASQAVLEKANKYYQKGCDLINVKNRNEADFNDAVRYFSKALEIRPGIPDYCRHLGWCYYNLNHIEEALYYYQKAESGFVHILEHHPNAEDDIRIRVRIADSFKMIAKCYQALHTHSSTIEYLKQAKKWYKEIQKLKVTSERGKQIQSKVKYSIDDCDAMIGREIRESES